MPWSAEEQEQARRLMKPFPRSERKTGIRDVLAAMGLISTPLDLLPREAQGVRPDFGMIGAGLGMARRHPGEYLPGEASQTDTANALWNIVESAGMENLPGIGPKKTQQQAPARVRPGHETEFAKWFEGSKITDEQGKPKTLYHGTHADFEIWDMNRLGDNAAHPSAHLGAFFAEDPSVASSFAERSGGRVKPVHIRMTNPLPMDAKSFAEELDFWQGFKAVRRTDGSIRPADDRYERSRSHFEDFKDWALQNGYDGIVIKGDPSM